MSDLNEENKDTIIDNSEVVADENSVDNSDLHEQKQKKPSFLSSFVDYVELMVIAISVVLVLFTFAFRTCTVDGDSMNKTLFDKEVLIVSDFMYTPERGDIIVFHQTGSKNMPLVKRVIGVGGDTVTIDFDTWTVTITDKDGQVEVLDEPYINVERRHSKSGIHEYVVPEGSLFVLGDNRNNSMDSTDSYNVGFVDSRRVLGKVIMRVSPMSKFGVIK